MPTLSNTSAMPCHSWGISARKCRAGSALVKVEGTTCSDCYALKGSYNYPNVKNAHADRLAEYQAGRADWVRAMAERIICADGRVGVFRWFDSGDLQSEQMLRDIFRVARLTPSVRHWIPTREHGTVRAILDKGCPIPANVTVRLSAIFVDGPGPERIAARHPRVTVSMVHTPGAFDAVRKASTLPVLECPKEAKGWGNCNGPTAQCRGCWNPRIAVSYPKH